MRNYIKLIRRIWLFLVLFIAIFCLYNAILNSMILITHYKIITDKIVGNKKGFIILHISDLHSVRSRRQVAKLARKAEKVNPDIIVITGDLIDATYYNNWKAKLKNENKKIYGDSYTIDFLKEIKRIAPIYYVFGNHEMMLLEEGDLFLQELNKIGIHMMNNQRSVIHWKGINIDLLGIQDPSTLYKDKEYAVIEGCVEKMKAMLQYVTKNGKDENITILLSHRPEYFELYGSYSIDLVLAGHAHGGQIVIPLIGGIYAPNQGWFPKYTQGQYSYNHTNMIVSRGLGNSTVPFRILNPPELVVVTLEGKVTKE